MSAAHTPGPWRYVRSGYGSKQADFDIVNAAGGRVASTPYEDKAALIAKAPIAPKLAEALRKLRASATNIEVLGEWSALDVNHTAQKRVRGEVQKILAEASAALAEWEAQ